jgi:hypothetical protein
MRSTAFVHLVLKKPNGGQSFREKGPSNGQRFFD